MTAKKFRQWVFLCHRYLGLVAGLIAIVVGLTGSLLVFQREIDAFSIAQQFGAITPEVHMISPEAAVNIATDAYASSNLRLDCLYFPLQPNEPYKVELSDANGVWTEVLINPYTGKVMGDRNWDKMWLGVTIKLHVALLAGNTGTMIVGIVAFVLLVLSLTGIVLWPGWRKLIAGFKIKLDAHPKRVNFDIHKIIGIIAAIFLALTAFTGFCWNFFDLTSPVIYALTFTQSPLEPTSNLIPGQSRLKLTPQLLFAQAALPDAVIRRVYFPATSKDSLRVRMKLPQGKSEYGDSNVYLDQYSGKVLRVDNALKMPLGDRVLNSFTPLHYGTFGGLPTRILYVFVGLAPLILFLTGFVMYWYRYRTKSSRRDSAIELSQKL